MDSVSVDNLKEQFCNDGEENVGSDELIEHATNHQSKVTSQKRRREQDNADAEEQQVAVGSRVAVWWPEDECFYEGEVTRKRKKLFFIIYDDGTEEWLDFREHKFHLLPKSQRTDIRKDKAKSLFQKTYQMYKGQVDVGSRVAVWWDYYQKFYEGEITCKRSSDGPFLVEYDDGDKEWVNFRKRKFHLLNTNAEDGNLELHSYKSSEEHVKHSEQAMGELDAEPESKILFKMGSIDSSNERQRDFDGYSLASEDQGDVDCEKPKKLRATGASCETFEEMDRERSEMKCDPISSANGIIARHGGNERDSDSDSAIADDESSDDENPNNPRARVPIKAILEDSDTSIPSDEKPNNSCTRVSIKIEQSETVSSSIPDYDPYIDNEKPVKHSEQAMCELDAKPESKSLVKMGSNDSSNEGQSEGQGDMDCKKPMKLGARGASSEIFEEMDREKSEMKCDPISSANGIIARRGGNERDSDSDSSITDDEPSDDEKPNNPRARVPVKAILEDSDTSIPGNEKPNNSRVRVQIKIEQSETVSPIRDNDSDMDDEKLNNPRARAPFKVILEDSESEDDTYSLPSSNDRPEPHPKDKNDVRETDMIKPEVTRHEPCSLCQTETMKEPRATSCQHIFCQICIKDHYKKDRTCPICRFPFGQRLCLTSEKGVEDAFRSVEQIDMTTGEVLHVYPSASAATTNLRRGRSALHVIDACQSKRKVDREFSGFFWRFHGSNDRVLRIDEAVTDGIPIEQVDLVSGKVIAVFSSSRSAAAKTGVNRGTIRRVLARRGKANAAGGYFWRFAGETHDPWEDPEPTNIKPVEKLCLDTGHVLATFKSLGDAKKAMGLRPNSGCIRETCDGSRMSTFGFFWRWSGSNALPPKISKLGKRVQLRKSRNGPVVKTFPNARFASDIFQVNFSTLCRWCRDGSKTRGFYWSYQSVPEIPEGEKLVSKRLRVHRSNGFWQEGRVQCFHAENHKHEIKYDSGETELVDLGRATFEWKNDQGQKPIEKLSFETGEVLCTYSSVTNAANELGVAPSLITAVIHGRSKSSRGFFFRYQGSKALPLKRKGRKVVEQLCLKTGRVIAVHTTIKEAAAATGITSPGISFCCNGRNGSKSAGGFGWRFAVVHPVPR